MRYSSNYREIIFKNGKRDMRFIIKGWDMLVVTGKLSQKE